MRLLPGAHPHEYGWREQVYIPLCVAQGTQSGGQVTGRDGIVHIQLASLDTDQTHLLQCKEVVGDILVLQCGSLRNLSLPGSIILIDDS